MRRLAILLTFWIVTWTQAEARHRKWEDDTVCVETTQAAIYEAEFEAAGRAAVLSANGYKNVQILKAEPTKAPFRQQDGKDK